VISATFNGFSVKISITTTPVGHLARQGPPDSFDENHLYLFVRNNNRNRVESLSLQDGQPLSGVFFIKLKKIKGQAPLVIYEMKI